MTAQEIEEIFRRVLEGYLPYPSLVMLAVIFGLVGAFLGSYLQSKGKNLATKEDIADITRKVEAIRSEYAAKLENLAHQNKLLVEQGNRKHQLRLVALEKRLAVHQKAFMMWQKLRAQLRNEEATTENVIACQKWWLANCLYLDQESRVAFSRAYHAAATRDSVLKLYHEARRHKEDDAESLKVQLQENREIIDAAGEAIMSGVELPALNEEELDMIDHSGEGKREDGGDYD